MKNSPKTTISKHGDSVSKPGLPRIRPAPASHPGGSATPAHGRAESACEGSEDAPLPGPLIPELDHVDAALLQSLGRLALAGNQNREKQRAHSLRKLLEQQACPA